MPHDFAAWMPSEDLLTTDELMTILEVGIDAGIDEVRLTPLIGATFETS